LYEYWGILSIDKALKLVKKKMAALVRGRAMSMDATAPDGMGISTGDDEDPNYWDWLSDIANLREATRGIGKWYRDQQSPQGTP
jgi:hypothetical protein